MSRISQTSESVDDAVSVHFEGTTVGETYAIIKIL